MNTEERIDTIIRQTIGREPSPYFPRTNDSSIQWMQLIHALDSQEYLGWPLLSPMKVQLQKCDKCYREFCSPINYRRHIRVHHRLKKLDKDFIKTRDHLGAYWDKLSVEEAKEVVSFENVVLEEVPGSSILKSLTTLIQNQGIYSFPPYYLMAGAALLDIVQSKSSIFPISSQQLFCVLDDASERTCLCGTAESVQRYVFDGEAGKIGLELRNLVACTSFLLEQKLVKAWLTDKDAEALRCQEQLVEEEEAARKRQTEISERKRQKKLRQKEQKAREQRHKAEAEIEGNIDSTVNASSLAEASLDTYNFEARNPNELSDNVTSPVPPRYLDSKEINVDTHSEYDTIADQNLERWSAHGHIHHCQAVSTQQDLPKWELAEANDLRTNQISPLSKLEVNQKYGANHEKKASAIVSGSKVCSPKSKAEIDKVVLKTTQEKEPDQLKKQEVIIGSIPVNLDNCGLSEGNMVPSQKDSMVEKVGKQDSFRDKPMKTEDQVPVQSGETEGDAVHGNAEGDVREGSTDGDDTEHFSRPEGRADPGSFQFSIQEAKAFLAKRWKEALSSDHVVLHLTSESESSDEDSITAASQSSDEDRGNIVANADNKLPATSTVAKSKPRSKKSEKRTKIKYVPKQKTNTDVKE